ncbi:PEP-CTERM sorting domain-containing protein [Anabaena lutea]|uniref:PEP-CTERM sorting domain-containing protein n=1 Tax=Anabaena lutea FACHB-196 TaxID=2692881 RepID=A0ABR8FJS2_9NOST|nr:PEP-CTERM sorting domain-containing protein [Anabaena lutea]MBD2570105.1 PEP-CTERM sorting domain-containing protein [Anabaena lutea FACHB-196]
MILRNNFLKGATGLSLLALGTLVFTPSAQAAAFSAIRIGDIDGFGYGTATGYQGAYGGPANVDGVGVLGTGDFLPDLNQNGVLATGAGDDFDNRSAAEKAGNFLTGGGFTDKGSTGSEYTDISLSTSFRNTFPNATTHPFPGDGNPATLSNQPGFKFDFFVNQSDIIANVPLFFNLVFGDYEVIPAQVDFTRADGTTFTRAVTAQPGTQDGLIQAAFVQLDFSDVFTANGSIYDGFLRVDFNAPNEPYTAFDFAEISTSQISIDPKPVPEPGTLLGLLAMGAFGAGSAITRKRVSRSV